MIRSLAGDGTGLFLHCWLLLDTRDQAKFEQKKSIIIIRIIILRGTKGDVGNKDGIDSRLLMRFPMRRIS